MKIGIQTWGSEGDVRPFLALAAGLRAAGHEATLVVTHITNKDYTAPGAALGVPVRHAGQLAADLPKLTGAVLVNETNVLKQVRVIMQNLFEPAATDMLAEAKRLCRENDLLIGHFLVHPLRTAAERAGKPNIPVFLAPMLPSAFFPPPGAPHLGTFVNTLLWKIGGVVTDRMFLPQVNAMRRAEGLRPLEHTRRSSLLSPRLNLVASSPALFPRPADWDETIHICGAFHYPEEHGARRLPEELAAFLAAGPPPVYMTFGSMSVADPTSGETVRLLAESARMAGCRALIQAEVRPGPDAEDILYLPAMEHHLVFPSCAAVVHHGGAGTTQAASRAGVPSIVVEHATDQVFWGGVLNRAGIAPPMLHRRTVTAAKLARAIRTTLDSPTMRERARSIGERMRKENGVKRAVALIGEQRW